MTDEPTDHAARARALLEGLDAHRAMMVGRGVNRTYTDAEILAEAQVHATLALLAPPPDVVTHVDQTGAMMIAAREVEAKDGEIQSLKVRIEARDSFITRLLDGWVPSTNGMSWVREHVFPDTGGEVTPMTDGELRIAELRGMA